MLPMITVVGGYAGLMVVFGVYNIFSIPSLITAIGALLVFVSLVCMSFHVMAASPT